MDAVHRENVEKLPARYQWWGRALNGETVETNVSKPQCGFYRMIRTNTETMAKYGVPVHVAPEDDGDDRVVADVGFDGVDFQTLPHEQFLGMWPWCASQPIPEALYDSVLAGAAWPDIDLVVWQQITGLDRVPEETEEQRLQRQINECVGVAGAYATIRNDEQQAQAQSLRSRLLELYRIADKKREAEKAPHWAECQRIEEKWLFRKLAHNPDKPRAGAAGLIHAAQEAYANVRRRREQKEQQQRREAEAAEARRKAEADRPAVGSAELPHAPDDNQPPGRVETLAADEPIAPAPPRTIRPGTGRASSEKDVQILVIEDWDKLWASQKKSITVQEFLLNHARRHFKATGEILPGCNTEDSVKLT